MIIVPNRMWADNIKEQQTKGRPNGVAMLNGDEDIDINMFFRKNPEPGQHYRILKEQ